MLLSSSQQGGKHLVALTQNPCEIISLWIKGDKCEHSWRMKVRMIKEVIANKGNTQWEFSSGLLSFTWGLRDFIKSCILKSFLRWNFRAFRCLYNFVRGSHLSSFDENTLKSWILNQLCKIQPDFFFSPLSIIQKIMWKQLESISAPEVGWNLCSASVRKFWV